MINKPVIKENYRLKITDSCRSQSGSVLIALLVSAASFSIVIYTLLAILATQFDFSFRRESHDQALNIAEAGINYYRWHLLQSPDDFTDGTGDPGSGPFGPYLHDYRDPQGNIIGQYGLTITPPQEGSTIVTVSSQGWTNKYPTVKRTVTAQYGQSSFARYAFLTSASSWFGSGITVYGPIHSNNGIRQDGANISTVTSAQTTYICGSETGCTGSSSCNSPCTWNSITRVCTCPGVWGAGGDQGLWEVGVPSIDFDTISFDFQEMRSEAQTNGVYYAASGNWGYNVVFNANGTFNIYRVTSISRPYGYAVEDGCQRRNQIITGQTLLNTYNISEAPIIFLEDRTWVSGTVNGRVSVVAARFPLGSFDTDIWINNNLVYLAKDENHSLGLIAQHDIYFGRDVPNDFEVDAALLAQQGHIIRHGYLSSCGAHANAVRNSLTLFGSHISNLKSYWNFGTSPSSGFRTRTSTYDANLLYSPPPYYPSTGLYDLITWEEE
jgi:hypothetical protein